MIDTLINRLRQTDDGPHDNRHLARFGWVILTLVGFMGVYFAFGELFVPSNAGTAAELAGVQEWAKFTFASAAIAIFVASLLWPARKIEAWLDARYPEHAVDDELDYSLRSDLIASTWFGGLWGFRLAVGYAVVSILIAMTSVFDAIAEEGYPLESAEVAQLTVLNSFAISVLTTLLAGIGFLWLINWSMKDTVEKLNTPENNTFGTPNAADRTVATDGGEDSGA